MGNLFASTEAVDERVTDIYFGNGILTTEAEALEALELTLNPLVKNEIYHGNEAEMNKYHNFDLAFNYSAEEQFGETAIAAILDMLEAYDQLGNTSPIWWTQQWLLGKLTAGLNVVDHIGSWSAQRISKDLQRRSVPRVVANYIADKVVSHDRQQLADLAVKLADYDPDKIHEQNLTSMVDQYRDSIEAGHGVIMVTHSQGNLFAVEASFRLPNWMKQYLYHVSIASPATRYASNNNWLISLDNDAVALLGGVGWSRRNPIRYFSYYLDHVDPYEPDWWLNDPTLLNQTVDAMNLQDHYWIYGKTPSDKSSAVVDRGEQFTIHMHPDELSFMQTDFHLFDYYMGETYYPVQLGNGTQANLNSMQTRRDISGAISLARRQHWNADSQWKEVLGCPGSCSEHTKVKHSDGMLDDPGTVYVFDPAGKVYEADGKLVKSLSFDGDGVHEIKDGTVCYELENTAKKIYGADTNTTLHSGVLEVTLKWERITSEYNLSILPNQEGVELGGETDVNTCQMVHYYVQSEDNITTGIYPVSVNPVNAPHATYLDGLDLSFKLPQNKEEKNMSFLHSDARGVVARIYVKKIDNRVIYYPGVHSTSSGSGSGSTNSRCQPGEPEEDTCGCMPCEYKVMSTLSGAYLGPLGGAEVKLYRLEAYKTGTPVYAGLTVDGSDLLNAGRFQFPGEFIAGLDDDALYVLEVQGGTDIDANDDMKLDTVPTTNFGTLHAVVSGEVLKTRQPKANILTEIAFQIVKGDLTGEDTNVTGIVATLDDVAGRLLRSKVYPNEPEPLSYRDLLDWLPQLDKKLTLVDYASRIEPIAQNVLLDREIYDDAYNVVYRPQITTPLLKATSLYVREDAAAGTQIGNVEVISEGSSGIQTFRLLGDSAHLFGIDDNGNVSTNVPLDFETAEFYSLLVQAVNGHGEGTESLLKVKVVDIPDAPRIITNDTRIRLHESTTPGTVVSSVVVEPGASPLVAVELEGPDSEWFSIDINGEIKLVKPLKPSGEKSAYEISIIAFNESEVSRPVALAIYSDTVVVAPKPKPFSVLIPENTTPGSVVGVVALTEGNSPVVSCLLSGTTAFTIDASGVIRIEENTTLDYETLALHSFRVTAINAAGTSESVDASVAIKNVPETAPTLYDLNVTIKRQTVAGSVVGSILADGGDSDIDYISLSPVSPFRALASGEIVVDGNLTGEGEPLYALQARAKNSFGYSNEADVVIRIDSTMKVGDLNLSAYENSTEGAKIGELEIVLNGHTIKTIELSGMGSWDFEIDPDGTIRVASGVTLDADLRQHYNLTVTVNEIYHADVNIHVRSRIIGSAETPHTAHDVVYFSDGTKIAVADDYAGIHIIDIRQPDSPLILSTYDTAGYAKGVALSDDEQLLYVADSIAGLRIIDISDPLTPYLSGWCDTPGRANNVVLSQTGNLAFVADETSALQVVDVSNPEFPVIIGATSLGNAARDVVVSKNENLAFVSCVSLIEIVDISNPETPVAIGTLDIPNKRANGIELSSDGTKLFVTDSSAGLYAVDIGDPTQPVIIGTLGTPSSASNVVVSADDTKAFVTDAYAGLHVIDISDPTAMAILETVDTPYYAEGIALAQDETKICVADWRAIEIIDITDIPIPSKVPGVVGLSIYVEENTLPGTVIGAVQVVYPGNGGLLSMILTGDGSEDFDIDLSGNVTLKNQLNKDVRGSYYLTATAQNSIGSRTAYVEIKVHAEPEIRPFVATIKPFTPEGTLVGTLDMGYDDETTLHDISLSGVGSEKFNIELNGSIYANANLEFHHLITPTLNLIVHASNSFGTTESNVTFNISETLDVVKLGGSAVDVVLNQFETAAYVASYSLGLSVVDISNPAESQLAGYLYMAYGSNEVALSPNEDIAYIAAGYQGFFILDIVSELRPNLLGSMPSPNYGFVDGVAISSDGTTAFLGSYNRGMPIVDVSISVSPKIVSTYTTYGYVDSVAISSDNRLVFVPEEYGGFSIVDISNPLLPVRLGNVVTPGLCYDVVISNDETRAFVADGNAGISVIDISNPQTPQIISSLDTDGYAMQLALSSDETKLFVADSYAGVQIIDIGIQENPTHLRTVPTVENVSAVAVSSSGSRLFIAEGSIGLRIVDLTGLDR